MAMASAGLLATTPSVSAQESGRNEPLTRGDIAILRFLAAAELIESDLWDQYAELGGVTDGSQNNYQLALRYLDGDGSQYITSNTLDENTHADFLGTPRLTNLMNLNVDTSWYIRYRSSTNPDFGATFPRRSPFRTEPRFQGTTMTLMEKTASRRSPILQHSNSDPSSKVVPVSIQHWE